MLASLVKLSEIKQYIEVNEENTSFDESLKQLARVATKQLENFCRRTFSAQEYTETFNTRYAGTFAYDLTGDYSNMEGVLVQYKAQRFPLKGFPINTEEDFEVSYDISRAFGDSIEPLVETDYFINQAGNALYLLKGTAEAYASLRVVYTGGYTTELVGTELVITGAPENLKLACVTQVMFLFNKYREQNIGVRGQKKHSPEYVMNEQMLCPEAQSMAFEFRRQMVGKR